jgi:HD-like signal output (HDOD) protein/CheY-like chemotaxis protein
MKQVLFVDDDPSVLESLRDALRPWRREWRATFACGGDAALSELSAREFDVVVSDMRMPGTDGAALLRQVHDLQPHAVRIMLSGSAETDVLTRAAAVAHRFLAKPCDVEELGRVVTHAAALGQMSHAQRLHGAASAAMALPCAPALYGELSALLATETAGMADVAALIERDIAVTARILQLTNSAFVGLPRVINRVEEAASLLGLGVVKAIVLSSEALAAYRPREPIAGFSLEALERHSALVAAMTRRLLAPGPARETACAAAMLHDIGWLILAADDPSRVGNLLAAASAERRPLADVERELDGPTHAEVGAHLLALWGLPDPIVTTIAGHHRPPAPVERGLDATAAVHIADLLIGERLPLWNTPAAAVDTTYLEALGVAEQLASWRASAADLVG